MSALVAVILAAGSIAWPNGYSMSDRDGGVAFNYLACGSVSTTGKPCVKPSESYTWCLDEPDAGTAYGTETLYEGFTTYSTNEATTPVPSSYSRAFWFNGTKYWLESAPIANSKIVFCANGLNSETTRTDVALHFDIWLFPLVLNGAVGVYYSYLESGTHANPWGVKVSAANTSGFQCEAAIMTPTGRGPVKGPIPCYAWSHVSGEFHIWKSAGNWYWTGSIYGTEPGPYTTYTTPTVWLGDPSDGKCPAALDNMSIDPGEIAIWGSAQGKTKAGPWGLSLQ